MRKMFDTSLNPKRFFLIDGAGAFITAVILFLILRPLDQYIGMPGNVLTMLSIIALTFCIYSLSCYFIVKKMWKPLLKAISIGNVVYCCFTLGLIVHYYPQLTILGLTYFLLEIAVICLLVYFEMKALKINNNGLKDNLVSSGNEK